MPDLLKSNEYLSASQTKYDRSVEIAKLSESPSYAALKRLGELRESSPDDEQLEDALSAMRSDLESKNKLNHLLLRSRRRGYVQED